MKRYVSETLLKILRRVNYEDKFQIYEFEISPCSIQIIQTNAVGEEFVKAMSCKYNGQGKANGSGSYEM